MSSLWHLQKRMLFPFESDNKFDASCTKKFLYRRNIAGASKEQSRVKSESRRWIQRGLNKTLRENLPWDECQDRKGYTNLVLFRAPTGRLTTVDNTRQCSGKIRTFRAERVRPSPTCNCSGTFLAPGLSAHHPIPRYIKDLFVFFVFSPSNNSFDFAGALSFIRRMIQLAPVYLYH